MLDSNIYAGHWERGLYVSELATIQRKFVTRLSAVVLSELRRGVRIGDTVKVAEGFYKVAHVQWEPAADDWWQAGRHNRREQHRGRTGPTTSSQVNLKAI